MRVPRASLHLFLNAVLLSLLALVSPPMHAQSHVICDDSCGGTPPGARVTAAPNAARGLGSATQPSVNALTSAAGSKAVTMEGSQSFTYAVPLFSFPGRAGLDLNLTLYYNSLVWTSNGASMTLNATHDDPSPGFRMDFGYIDIGASQGSGTGILVDSAGATHQLIQGSSGFSFVTNDSTNIQIQFSQDFSSGVATSTSGSTATYTLDPTKSLYRPTKIEDTNGNYINIIYNNDNIATANLQLGQIHDSVGRTIFFKYDNATHTMVQAITAVDANNVQLRTFTFNWTLNLPVNFAFTQTTGTFASGSTINVLSGITRPNGTQVVFNYGDWGIVNQVKELSGNNALRYSTSYNFPLASAGKLSSNPTYTQQTVFDGVNTGIWSYSAQTDANGLVTNSSSTDPSGTVTSVNFLPASAGAALQGLPSQTLICSAAPCSSTATTLLRTLNRVWGLDSAGANPRLSSSTTILEDGNTQAEKIFAYDANGNVRDVQEFDYGAGHAAALVKETVTTYATLGNGILNRPSRIVVQHGAGVADSRIDINYDEVPVSDVTPNPAGHDAAFTSSQTVRGNPTSIIRYSNPGAGTGGITTTFTYDALGNVLTDQTGSRALTQRSFSSATGFSSPDSVTVGPAGNQYSTSFTYAGDGQIASSTDANGGKTTYTYDTIQRLATITTPDQITTAISFDDLAANPSKTVSSSVNSAVAKSFVDGLGRNLGQQLLNGTTIISQVTQSNDILGRPLQISNPSASTPSVFTTYSYDALGRVTQVTRPSVEAATQNPYITSYSGTVATTTDPAGRVKKTYSDVLGRLVRVDEPGLINGQFAQGSLTITGSDLSIASNSAANGATASVTIQSVNTTKDGNGSVDRSTQVQTHAATPASVTVTVGGSDGTDTTSTQSCTPTCRTFTHNFLDTGTMSFFINVGGTVIGSQVSYSGTSTAASLASGLAAGLPANSLVTVNYVAGSTSFTITTTATGSATNSSLLTTSIASSCTPSSTDTSQTTCQQGWTITGNQNFSGGTDKVISTVYDTGNVTVTVGVPGAGAFSKTAQYSQNSTPTSIAYDLFNQFINDSTFGANVRTAPSASGNGLQFTTVATGANTNDTLNNVSVTTSNNFSPGSTSFTVSPAGSSNFNPGQTGVLYDSGTITATLTGFALSAVRETVNFGEGSTTASVAATMAAAFNKDPFSPVNASVPAGSSTINFTARLQGTDANYFAIASAEQSNFPAGTFSGTSFPAASASLSGGVDPTPSLDPGVVLTTTYSYDPLGHLLQVNQGQQVRTYQYDGLGRKTSEAVPETSNVATTIAYQDTAPLQTTVTDPRQITATSTFDSFGRLTGVTYSDGTPRLTYTYGAGTATDFSVGRITQITDAAGTESYQYDNVGHIIKTTRIINGNTYITKLGYTNGALSSVGYPSGRIVGITQDATGRLSQISSGGINLLTINSYNAAGQVLSDTYGNGMQGTFGYNDQQQLSSIQYGNNSGLIMNLSYTYDGSYDNGQIASITDALVSSRSTQYTYDELGRLKRARTTDLTSPNTWLMDYRYDRYGNRLAQIPGAGTASQPMSEITVDPTTNHITSVGQYDPNGNMTDNGINNFTYNALDQITMVDSAHPSVYDSNGLRVINDGTYEIYSGGNLIAEYANGAAAASPSLEFAYAGGQRIATFAGGTTTYPYWDHLSKRVVADSNGNVVRTYGSFPFGETWYETGTVSKFKFTTYLRDAASGLDYAQRRFDSPTLGRFLSLDPLLGSIDNPQSLNRYAYVVNDPINLVDPSGLAPHDRTTHCEILADGSTGRCFGSTGCTVDGLDAINCGHLDEWAGGVSLGTCPPVCGVGVGVSTTVVGAIAFGLGDPESEERRLDCIAEGGTHCGPAPASFDQFDQIAALDGGVFFGCHSEACRKRNAHKGRLQLHQCLANAKANRDQQLAAADLEVAIGIAGILGDIAFVSYILPQLSETVVEVFGSDGFFDGIHAAQGATGMVGLPGIAPALLYGHGVNDLGIAKIRYSANVDDCYAKQTNHIFYY